MRCRQITDLNKGAGDDKIIKVAVWCLLVKNLGMMNLAAVGLVFVIGDKIVEPRLGCGSESEDQD